MPTSSAAAAVTTLTPSFFPNHPKIKLPTNSILTRSRRTTEIEIKIKFSCLVAVTTDVSPSSSSSSSASLSDEELKAQSKIGKRIRVRVPLKVYHVNKAPDLDLNGMEGEIKQYVGVWKGKSISANLPFKVEFFVTVEGQEKPVKFFAHLKEDEFEYLDDV